MSKGGNGLDKLSIGMMVGRGLAGGKLSVNVTVWVWMTLVFVNFYSRIPKKFVRKFRDELSGFATIIASDGQVWQVGLLKNGGKIWFHHGLQDFIEYYSICVGYFLVFKYEKRSNFHVIILDMSTFEISYPYNFEEPKKKENLIHKKEDYRDQQSAANPNSSSNKCKMEEHVEVNTNTAHNGEDEHPTRIKDLHKVRALLEDKRIFLSQKYKFSSAKERERLFTLARSLKPTNPSFVIVLWPSHLHNHFMSLPAKFANMYLTRDTERIKVRASNGREWPVQIGWKKNGCLALRGWTRFLNDMKLKTRDICVFELMRTEYLLLEVLVFKESGKHVPSKFLERHNLNLPDSMIFRNEQGRQWPGQAFRWNDGYFLVFKYEKRSNFHVIILNMSTFEISYPYDFEEPKNKENLIHKKEDYRDQQGAANLNSSSNKCKMEEHVEVNRTPLTMVKTKIQLKSKYLPAQFTNRYLTRDIERFKVRASNGREWPVRMSWKNHGCCALRGWTKFLNDMKIKTRDICVFELIQTKDLLLEVSLFKESGKVI
ncbi:hypothetical protein LWI29_029782 [Acer saccharum]|uniref:TF-B3 domain-containing protein n=1 Tax=Acer saccharum TaxID=4024 RepID=A0AA39SM36_ACESA|nr:hypothetical protein LWI29_029782 [Acer saccharum]